MNNVKIRVLFMGRKLVAAKALRLIANHEDVEVVGVLTDSHLEVSPTAECANSLGLKLFTFSEALVEMKNGKLLFDLGLSVLYWRKLRDEVITIPRFGVINFHPAPLPEYKGTAGYNLAILEGLDKWAVSAHYIDDDIDTGKIIKVLEFDISKEFETVQTLEAKSQIELLRLFENIFNKFILTRSVFVASPNIGGRYVSRDEMEALKEIKPGDDLPRKIRAFWFPPYHGAYIMIDGCKYTLVDDSVLKNLADPTTSSLFSKKS